MHPRRKNVMTVGLFDSGVGGLSVLSELKRLSIAPDGRQYRFLYVGDTARCPYGNRDRAEIALFVEQIINWLVSKDAECIVMACNTSAALALDRAQAVSSVPVYNLIAPTARYLADRFSRVAVLATHSTIKSRAFSSAACALNESLDVVEIACPDLVPLVESGRIAGDETRRILSKYADQLRQSGVEAAVLGCTHFPFLIDSLSELLPRGLEIIDPARLLFDEIEPIRPLKPRPDGRREIDRRSSLHCTGDVESFAAAASICLGIPRRELGTVYGVSVDELARQPHADGLPVPNVVSMPGSAVSEAPEPRSIGG